MGNPQVIPKVICETIVSMLKPFAANLTEDDIQALAATVQSDDKLLKVKEAAGICNVSPLTIRRMIKAERIKAHKIGGSLRVSYNSLKALL
jgi:excisionase family DNA binding protein